MLNGLDLFSGIGRLAYALDPWIEPVAYCENNRYAQGVLLSRMGEGRLRVAPIWDNVRTLLASFLPPVDIICAGSPCQNFSACGDGKGLDGDKSSLFWEIPRLGRDLGFPDIFLENVPAISSRGGVEITAVFTQMGYECRWGVVPAIGSQISEGDRWFLMAASPSARRKKQHSPTLRETAGYQKAVKRFGSVHPGNISSPEQNRLTEPPVLRTIDDVPYRVDRIKCCGNTVDWLQARAAFEILSGIRGITA